MIMLHLSVITHEAEARNFSCQIKDIESGFDLLCTFVERGETLVNASLIDATGRIQLPVEAFDEHSMSESIRQLTNQWEGLLKADSKRPVQWNSSELKKYISFSKRQRTSVMKNTLAHMQYLMQVAQDEMREGPCKTRLLRHYQGIIDRYTNSLARYK
jgi:hypothetical protein